MNAPVDAALLHSGRLAEQVATACDRIAPNWPLDQFIAVNPYWGWRGQPIEEAAAWLGTLTGTRLTMPRSWYRERWQRGELSREDLQRALQCLEAGLTVDDLVQVLESADSAQSAKPPRLPLITDLRDAAQRPVHMPGWPELVTHQLSQHCASFFDDGVQARWSAVADGGLFATWKRALADDRGIPWQRGRPWLIDRLNQIPADPLAAIETGLLTLGIAVASASPYLTALLGSINGWAAWCAYRRRQARLAGVEDDSLCELLAARATWDVLLAEDGHLDAVRDRWAATWVRCEERVVALEHAQRVDWVLQTSLELAYRRPLARAIVASGRTPKAAPAAPRVQAVFCIDVRSEVFRRALETVDPGMATRGFAGFFGMPVAYRPMGSELVRPQLPGLLAPAFEVTESLVHGANSAREGEGEGASLGQALAERRRAVLGWRRRWANLRAGASSAFGFVEACGLAYGAKLAAASLPNRNAPARWEDEGLARAERGLPPSLPGSAIDSAAAIRLAKNVLHAMDLERDFAPLVLLVGHGSQSANNAHAAGLDCGACGGQTGEVNARVLAELLNRQEVRNGLVGEGIAIPPSTCFIPALHNTTTDEVVLFDIEAHAAAHRSELQRLRAKLDEAGHRTRRERSGALGMDVERLAPEALKRAFLERANDWSQIRPEWGLAGNAAFIVARRERTFGLDLQGRAFLHDYDHRQDTDLSVLTLIMTAPMVVTNWINLQYFASTVDNRRYGSGNKVLHNVVDGHLGVFEGNGGDLRIGLPMQSLHDGQRWRHEPLRLTAIIEAPRDAIERVISEHAVVRELIQHRWLHLMRIDSDPLVVEELDRGSWLRVA